MGKPGFVHLVSASGEDSERAEVLEAEVTWTCVSTRLHAPHTWPMSATGWCYCPGLETTPIFDYLASRYAKWGWLESILDS